MSKPLAITIDASTGEVISREYTNQELAAQELLGEQVQAEKEARVTARESALAKLAALGLTEEEIGAL